MKIERISKRIAAYREELNFYRDKLKSLLLKKKKFVPLKKVIELFFPTEERSPILFYKTLHILRRLKDFKVAYLQEAEKHRYYVGLRGWKISTNMIEDLPKVDRVRMFLEKHPDEVFTVKELSERLGFRIRSSDLPSLPRVKVDRNCYYGCIVALEKFKEYLRKKGVSV